MRKYIILLLIIITSACNNFLDHDPAGIGGVDTHKAIQNINDLEAALLGVYDGLQGGGDYYGLSFIVYPDLLCRNLQLGNSVDPSFWDIFDRRQGSGNISIGSTWNAIYVMVQRANFVIHKGVNIHNSAPLLAEARFLRALGYFDLARMFSITPTSTLNSPVRNECVPLITEPSLFANPDEIPKVGRNSVAEVYQFILEELLEAEKDLLMVNENGRVSKMAAKALLARVYLYYGEYDKAIEKADEVIYGGGYKLNDDYMNNFWIKFSPESIFEIYFNFSDRNQLANTFYDPTKGANRSFFPSTLMFLAYQDDDLRGIEGLSKTPSQFFNKYFRIFTEDDNVIVLRLAEMYLILAEAEARHHNAVTEKALNAVNKIRERAFGGEERNFMEEDFASVEEFLIAIEQERNREFVLEGHRSFDLLRTNRVEAAILANPHKLIFPIPLREIQINGDIMKQNHTY
jgi:starch-binding outer membrane protein, SusD/RagB family